MLTTIAAFCTRVKNPNQDDWRKLVRLLKYVNGTREDKLILAADNLHVIKWHVDASFAVQPDIDAGMRSSDFNVEESSKESELVGADDVSTMILWTKLFMKVQAHVFEKTMLNQVNKSTNLLETNGKRSSSKRTLALNIRYFFFKDQVEKGNLMIEYCPTTEMTADFMTKSLQGTLFRKFKKLIMGH